MNEGTTEVARLISSDRSVLEEPVIDELVAVRGYRTVDVHSIPLPEDSMTLTYGYDPERVRRARYKRHLVCGSSVHVYVPEGREHMRLMHPFSEEDNVFVVRYHPFDERVGLFLDRVDTGVLFGLGRTDFVYSLTAGSDVLFLGRPRTLEIVRMDIPPA